MLQSQLLMEALKRVMRERGMRYAQVAAHLEVSESSVKRLFSKHDISLQRLEQICDLLEVSMLDLARSAQQPVSRKPRALTEEQELGLARHPAALNYFYKLLQERAPAQIADEFGISPAQASRVLGYLEGLALICREPGDRVRLLVDRRVAWQRAGPLAKRYKAEVQRQFLQHDFAEAEASLNFQVAELSLEARGLLTEKIARLHQEFDELAERSLEAPVDQRVSTGMLLGARPWRFRGVEGLDPETEFGKLPEVRRSLT